MRQSSDLDLLTKKESLELDQGQEAEEEEDHLNKVLEKNRSHRLMTMIGMTPTE